MSSLLLEALSIAKSFAGVQALKGVSFTLREGEVHALIGENGAGKSTLVKVVTGAERADAGVLVVSGRPVHSMDPRTARSLGIAAIYQQPSLFPHLTVAENITLTLEQGGRWRRIDWRARNRKAAELLHRVGAAIDPQRLVETLTMPEQQLVEIAKAVGAESKILVMDEPTAALSDREVQSLFRVVTLLRSQGVGIIYISHRLDEVLAIADRITVLRDGETIDTRPASDLDRTELIRMMVGRELETVFPKRRAAIGDVALELRHVANLDTGVRDVSLALRRGEILGLAGLVGSGRTELAEILFGLTPAQSGEIRIRDVPIRIQSPGGAIRAGIGYLPEDRRRHGIVPEMSIAANASLANLHAFSRRGLIDRVAERSSAERYVEQFRIKALDVSVAVETLSGGNQQKVALARWLSIGPSVLVLDEPTQGVDVGSKAEIHGLMQTLAERGVAILMISSELQEILGMSDRIAVMHHGTIRGVLGREDATPQKILALALNQTPPGGSALPM